MDAKYINEIATTIIAQMGGAGRLKHLLVLTRLGVVNLIPLFENTTGLVLRF